MGDMMLPESEAESVINVNISSKVIKIFQADDLEDTTRARVDPSKLQYFI